MFKKKGFTLIEIIVSLAIFAIISVGFLGMFTTVFINTYKTSEITENSFASQSIVEEKILDVKTKIENNNHSAIGLSTETITIFNELGSGYSKNISVYHLKEGVTGGRPIETLVSQIRPPSLVVPIITSNVEINAIKPAREDYPNIGMKSLLSIKAEEPVVDKPGFLIQHLYYWYKTNQKHYVKSLGPVFPDEYEIITSYTGKIITSVSDDYASKFVRLMITPVGEKGKMGSGYPSNEVLISGLPTNDNLLIHLDASMIDLGTDVSSDRVIRWKDIGGNRLSVSDSSPGNRPLISQHTVVDNEPHQVLGVERFASGSNQQLILNQDNTINAGKRNVTVYVVAKFDALNSISNNVTIIESRHNNQRYRWTFGTDENGQLLLHKQGSNTNDGQKRIVALNDSEFRTGEWSILRLDVYDDVIRIYNGLNLVEETYSFTATRENTSGLNQDVYSTPMRINFNNIGYSMSEILVYEGKQSDTDSQKVLEYLFTKFIGE